MNEPVSLELAKLLKEKEFDKPTINFYSASKVLKNYSLPIKVNLLTNNYAAPTIVDVVM